MIVREKLSDAAFAELCVQSFGDMTKIVVDIERGILSAGCELHVDCAEELLSGGSKQHDLWGANVYQDKTVDFVSLINIRPKAGNRSMEIHDPQLREKIGNVVKKFL